MHNHRILEELREGCSYVDDYPRTIDGNEMADRAYAKDAPIPETEEALHSQADWVRSLSHIARKTTEKMGKQGNEWFHLKCDCKKYDWINENHNQNMIITRTEKSTSQIIY
jgi:hypothetical protein